MARAAETNASAIRASLRNRRKLHFHYSNAEGRASERTVRPLALAFYGPVWLLIAWCELRDDFRRRLRQPVIRVTDIPFDVTDRHIVLVDDVIARLEARKAERRRWPAFRWSRPKGC